MLSTCLFSAKATRLLGVNSASRASQGATPRMTIEPGTRLPRVVGGFPCPDVRLQDRPAEQVLCREEGVANLEPRQYMQDIGSS